jgi:hypothetical protein
MTYAMIDTAEAERIAMAYVANRRAVGPDKQSHFWAFEKVCDFIYDDEPENAWNVLVTLTSLPGNTSEDIAYIAAGPAEDLLCHYGDAFIGRFEEMAQKEPAFRRLLGGVWKRTMHDNVWERVLAVSGPPL